MGIYKQGRPSRQIPPDAPGEYRWINKKTGKNDYMGETVSLRNRHAQHIRSAKAVSNDTHYFEWKQADGRSTSRTRRIHESEKIETHNPTLNLRAGGGGRKAKK